MRDPATLPVVPVAAWPEYDRNRVVVVASDGQLYALPVLGKGQHEAIATVWTKLGPPIPNSAADNLPHRDPFAEAQDRYIVRLRAALHTLGKTNAEIDAIVRDED